MSRNIVTKRDVQLAQAGAAAVPGVGTAPRAAPPPPPPDDYVTKLMKYIPAEVVSLYVALDAIINANAGGGGGEGARWFIFVVGLAATPLYLWRRGKVDKVLQLLISTVAFCVWIFALGGPFDSWSWYQTHTLYAALALPIYTFLVGLIDP